MTVLCQTWRMGVSFQLKFVVYSCPAIPYKNGVQFTLFVFCGCPKKKHNIYGNATPLFPQADCLLYNPSQTTGTLISLSRVLFLWGFVCHLFGFQILVFDGEWWVSIGFLRKFEGQKAVGIGVFWVLFWISFVL